MKYIRGVNTRKIYIKLFKMNKKEVILMGGGGRYLKIILYHIIYKFII